MRENKAVKASEITEREYSYLEDKPSMISNPEIKTIEDKNPVEVTPRKPILITKALIWRYFLLAYKVSSKKPFEKTQESLANIGTIINYFVRDPEFLKSPNLVKQVGRSTLQPSLSKGLLIVGMYGNGKTSIMRALSMMFSHYDMPMRFKSVSAHGLVTKYETLSTPGDKDLFYERYNCKALHIDDVKKEATASNYGKREIIRDIMEKRYDNGLMTYLTCNYREGDADGNVGDALMEFGERYGEHIYDRLFEMFNIIQFKGSSFR